MAYQRNRIGLYDARNRKYRDRGLIMLGFATILLASLGISANEVLAMGQAPSTCNNRYDGTITYMKITVGHRTYYPMADPGLSFELKNNRSYTVEFTIHTANQSSQNSTSGGTTWYDTDSPGYQIGTCVSGAAPGQDITVVYTQSHPANLAPEATQNVTWNTMMPGEITYDVRWANP